MLPENFRRVLGVPGSRQPLIGAMLGRLPFAGLALAVLLMVKEETGSFADAGLVQAMFSAGEAIGLPVQGRLVDRLGQTRVITVCALVCASGLTALTALVAVGASLHALMAAAAAAGLFFPPLATAMRTLIDGLMPERSLRESAFALDAVNAELAFIVGPLLTGLVIGLASPSAAVLVNAALMVAGVLVFATSRASRAWRGARHELGLIGPLRSAGVLALMAVAVGIGVLVGAIELGMTALASDEGHRQAVGGLVAMQAAGSLAGGLWYGTRSWSGSAAWRLPLLATALALVTAPLLVVPSLAVAFPLMLVSGIGYAPTITAVYSLLTDVAPPGTATEATGWILTAVVIGIGIGTGLAGAAVGAADYHAGLAVGFCGAVACAAAAWAGRGTLSAHAGGRPDRLGHQAGT